MPAALGAVFAFSAGSSVASSYPDVRAFLIYAAFGTLAGAALGIWNQKFRTVLKFTAVLFTSAVVAGVVGPAASSVTNAAIAPLAAFIAALLAPAVVLDPIGTIKTIVDLIPRIRLATKPGAPDKPEG